MNNRVSACVAVCVLFFWVAGGEKLGKTCVSLFKFGRPPSNKTCDVATAAPPRCFASHFLLQ